MRHDTKLRIDGQELYARNIMVCLKDHTTLLKEDISFIEVEGLATGEHVIINPKHKWTECDWESCNEKPRDMDMYADFDCGGGDEWWKD